MRGLREKGFLSAPIVVSRCARAGQKRERALTFALRRTSLCCACSIQ